MGVGQFFSRCSTPFAYVATGQPVASGSNTPGTRAAAAVPANANVKTAALAAMNFFIC